MGGAGVEPPSTLAPSASLPATIDSRIELRIDSRGAMLLLQTQRILGCIDINGLFELINQSAQRTQ